MGAGGVWIGTDTVGDQVSNHTVQECFIHDGGKYWQAGIGVIIQVRLLLTLR